MSSPTITLYLPSLEGGGAQRVFVELANEFAELGLRVNLALAAASGPYLPEVSPRVRIIDFDAPGVLKSMPRLVRHLRSERPDVLLSGLDHANVVAILAGVVARSGTRCVVSMRSVPTAVYRESRTIVSRVLLPLIRASYPIADAIVANSEAVTADLSRILRIDASKLHTVYNPLNLSMIEERSREDVRHPWCADGESPLILSVGSLTALKDFSTLVRAFSIVRATRTCRLAILGEGPQRPQLESLIRELGVERDVHLAGFVANPYAWMRRASVFVSSSLTEGCPNALMQALACGTPVVTTDCMGGSAEIVQHGKWGRLVAVGDATAMADAIEQTLQAQTRLDVRQRARDFGHRTIALQYLRILLPDYVPSPVGD